MNSIEIRALREGERDALIASWNCVFAGDPDRAGLSPAAWEWKYHGNPAGMRVWIAAKGSAVVAHIAAVPRRVWIGGREVVFSEVVDPMVQPLYRAGHKRPGLLANIAEAMLAAIGGPGQDLVCYGWPSPLSWRAGRRFLQIELLRTQSLLEREVGAGSGDLPAGVEQIERFDHQALWLWERCCGSWGASGIRDDAFLNWRFCDHPAREYRILGVRDSEGILRGFTVLFVGNWLAQNRAVLVDWLVPPGEPEVGRLLVEGALALARRAGAKVMTTLLPEWSAWYDIHQRGGFRVFPSDLRLATRPFVRKYNTLWLRDNWWYTLADSDQL